MCSSLVPEDLSVEERDELSNIRRRKKELLDDIEVLHLKSNLARVDWLSNGTLPPFFMLRCIPSRRQETKRLKFGCCCMNAALVEQLELCLCLKWWNSSNTQLPVS